MEELEFDPEIARASDVRSLEYIDILFLICSICLLFWAFCERLNVFIRPSGRVFGFQCDCRTKTVDTALFHRMCNALRKRKLKLCRSVVFVRWRNGFFSFVSNAIEITHLLF